MRLKYLCYMYLWGAAYCLYGYSWQLNQQRPVTLSMQPRTQVRVDAPFVRLQDIFKCIDSRACQTTNPVLMVLQDTQRVEVSRRHLLQLLQAKNIQLSASSLEQIENIQITPEIVYLTCEELLRHILVKKLKDTKISDELRFQYTRCRFKRPLKYFAQMKEARIDIDFEFTEDVFLHFKTQKKHTQPVTLNFSWAEDKVKTSYVAELNIIVQPLFKALQANKNIQAQTPLSARDFQTTFVKKHHHQHLIDKIVDHPQVWIRKNLKKGDVLRDTDVYRPYLVKQGQKIKMVVAKGNLVIHSSGIARQNGQLGETIRIYHVQTKRKLYGQIKGKGLVEVQF
ncbi:MAG: flagellar basal body P-ring formation chaperone FlgA [Zetaproteobacteria bacterium]|nr:flagellar basal body P-ring formation chaperone FlgA [Zetaproteobacteria bacterium]